MMIASVIANVRGANPAIEGGEKPRPYDHAD
jgi:hypothetical protein